MTARILLTFCFITLLNMAQADGAQGPMRLWFEQPARDWTEALPVGNGRLGGMVFGGVEKEHIQFNEDTLWTGHPQEYQHAGAVAYLPQIRKLLAEGKQREAEQLALKEFMSVPLRHKAYQPFGDLWLKLKHDGNVAYYRRELDLDSATESVYYEADGVTYERTIFSSYPDQSIVLPLTANQPGHLTFTVGLAC